MPTSKSSSDMATKPPQSLPSFAQTFGGSPSSINRLPDMNTSLPPIQQQQQQQGQAQQQQPPPPHRPPQIDRNRSSPSQRPSPQPQQHQSDSKHTSRKRLHAESAAATSEDNEYVFPSFILPAPHHAFLPFNSDRRSPRSVRIKQEVDYEHPIPPSSQRQSSHSHSQPPHIQETSSITPSAASPIGPNPSKKRRVTISGISQPINTDVRRPSIDSGISPVVMGFTIMRDDPAALEQVRSMITVKQKQKALIEQRRGSTADASHKTTGQGWWEKSKSSGS
ncbi:hypothetical protein NLI96_g10789 [Meripilus lineatus]|uniref:Uncharacterized protein n=1 Tax=Meripilus lineatus TaxID=2056292 RepID=A0AAD5Y9S2_9APHY|nr:hypothetical protein NLI96_g10789 [Physisporinus lineatus]